MQHQSHLKAMYGDLEIAPCPFTESEIAELEESNELLIYLPKQLTPREMCKRWAITANVDFEAEKMIRSVMVAEDQWFVCSASKTPELIYQSGQAAQRLYEDQGLHGPDMRRYLAFCATFRFIRTTGPTRPTGPFCFRGATTGAACPWSVSTSTACSATTAG